MVIRPSIEVHFFVRKAVESCDAGFGCEVERCGSRLNLKTKHRGRLPMTRLCRSSRNSLQHLCRMYSRLRYAEEPTWAYRTEDI